jgi:hypothetical protein
MSNTTFASKGGGAPFPRTAAEWQEKGYSPDQAERKVAEDVFGHDFKVDAIGKPIEEGIGSERNQTTQHKQALQVAAAARSAMHSRVGFTPTLVNAFDAKAEYIAELQAKLAKHDPAVEALDPRDAQIAELEAKLAELKRPN